MEANFEALWKKLEFPSSLKLFPPSQLALNICSCGSGLDNSASVKSGGVDHTLNNMDVSYFDKVKCSMPETCRRAKLSDTSDREPQLGMQILGCQWEPGPTVNLCQQSPAGASLGVSAGHNWSHSNGSEE